jgi:hypothetical protein
MAVGRHDHRRRRDFAHAEHLVHDAASSWLYAEAFDRYTAADASATDAAEDYAGLLTRAERATAQSEALEAVADPAYVSAEAIASLVDASDELASTLHAALDTELTPRLGIALPADHAVPAWERYADVARLLESRDLRLEEVQEFEIASRVVSTVRAIALDSQEGLFDALTAAGEQADPVRAEIEAFARSISGGVTLDFAWAYEVNGLPSDEWYSGTAQFWPTDGTWGLINLTHSISDNWYDDPNAKAVVVHEVGHTQVVRPNCEPLFTGPEFAGDHEQWATAWAIGMGYDLPGSGIEAYGRPTDGQIEVAAHCR